MKSRIFLISICFFLFVALALSCSKQESEHTAKNSTAAPADDATIKKLEKYLGVPIYPGARIADIFTMNRDNKIPNTKMDTSVKLIIDDYEKVVQFYETKLGQKFFVDEDLGKKYYTLRFEQDIWLFEIFVGQDTYLNQPIYEIQMMSKE